MKIEDILVCLEDLVWKDEMTLVEDNGLVTHVKPEEDGRMLREIIYGRLRLSRGLLRRMKSGGGVYLNGQPAYITQRGRSGDELAITFADSQSAVQPEAIPLDIVYEDAHVLVVNKPVGMAVHPTRTYPNGTLANGIAALWEARGYERRVRLMHRLDRETSGLLIIAKEPYAYQRLSLQFQDRTLQRHYLAVVAGNLGTVSGTISEPIGRRLGGSGHSLRRAVVSDGKAAITHYRLVQQYQGCSLVQLALETGRTHQIRVHMAWLGHPLVGDEMYGGPTDWFPRQALHAYAMDFTHPRTGEMIHLHALIPADMKRLLQERKIQR